MDLLVRLFLRLGVLLELPVQPAQSLRPIPVPVRNRPAIGPRAPH